MSAIVENRQCPYCATPTDAPFCALHSAPTIDLSLLSLPNAPVQSGHVIAERYRVDELIGEGLSGVVHRGVQLAFGREVAVKIVKSKTFHSARPLLRFFREAHSIGRLNHPNIVQVFDFGVDPQTRSPYLVFELVEGQTLTEIIRSEGKIEPKRATQLMAQTARALAQAHSMGIVHRDIKPNNLMVTRLAAGVELVKVLDFGLAKTLSDAISPGNLTTPGKLIGTPHFTSPEQAMGQPVDPRTDLYSLGCTLYACIAARAPFIAESMPELIELHRRGTPPQLPVSDPRLIEVYEALLAKHPEKRPASAVIVAEILEAIALDKPIDLSARLHAARTHIAPLPAAILDAATDVPTRETEVEPITEERLDPNEAATRVTTTQNFRNQTARDEATLQGNVQAHDLIGDDGPSLDPTAGMVPSPTRDDMPALEGSSVTDPVIVDPAATPLARPILTPPATATKSRAPWMLLVLVVLVVTVGWLLDSMRTAPAVETPAPAVQPVVERPAPVIEPRRAPDRIVNIRSAPPGATVRIGTQVVGTTPVDVFIPANQPSIEVVVEKAGHRTTTIDLPADEPVAVIELVAKTRPPAKRTTPRNPQEKAPDDYPEL